jgi:hypothetical protein
LPTNNDEIERLKRLRDQQIKTRNDPNEKKAKFEQISYQKRLFHRHRLVSRCGARLRQRRLGAEGHQKVVALPSKI